jgi:hypothetical protein
VSSPKFFPFVSPNFRFVDATTDIPPGKRRRAEHLSTDGKWRSFPKVPNLLQSVSNGNYYGRIKVGGKVIRESLETTVWAAAKSRLVDFLKAWRALHLVFGSRPDPPPHSSELSLSLDQQML